MRLKSYLFFICFLVSAKSLYAVGSIQAGIISANAWKFVENAGQIAEPAGETGSGIKYYGHEGNVWLFCKPGIISFEFNAPKEYEKTSEANGAAYRSVNGSLPRSISVNDKTQHSCINMVLLYANLNAAIVGAEKQEYYENYYQANGPESGITHISTYKKLIYKSIYHNIDMVLYSNTSGLKYEFLVHPGGRVRDIKIKWEGLECLTLLKEGGISYSFSGGTMYESAPISYQSVPRKMIATGFVLSDHLVAFQVDHYNKNKDLIIDPTLIWATYFGGENGEYGYGITTDAQGNVYTTGSTASLTGIASPGAFQPGYGGNRDAFVAKFSSTGVRLWSSYFGGTQDDAGYCIAVDKSGALYIAGYTGSPSGIATTGASQPVPGGYYDAFLTKFSSAGQRIWGTYFGGSGDDRAYGVGADGPGAVMITGYTSSDTGIATKGACQTSFGGGVGDVFIARYTSSGEKQWSTYYGGTGDDRGNAITADNAGNIYVTGITSSISGIATPGSFQQVFQGSTSDAFVARFSPGGVLSWASYAGASCEAHGIAIDSQADIIITGETSDSIHFAGPNAYQALYGGGTSDAFVSKVTSTGYLLWNTYFGGEKNDYGYAIAVDDSQQIIITGRTNSSTGIVYAGAYKTIYGGGSSDAFVAKYTPFGILEWGTYYGGQGTDLGYGVATDRYGNIYVSGQTSSLSDIATPGASQQQEGGSDDAFIAKFGYKYKVDAGVYKIISPAGSYCPGIYRVLVQLKNFGTGTIDSVIVNWSINSRLQPVYHWYGKLRPDSAASVYLLSTSFPGGNDTLKAWTSEPNGMVDSFPANDSAFSDFVIYPLPDASAGPDTVLCYDESYTMQGVGGAMYQWIPARFLSSATDPGAVAILSDTSEYYTLIVTNLYGCKDTTHVLLKVRPKLQVKAISSTPNACFGDRFALYANETGGYSKQYETRWPADNGTGDTLMVTAGKSGWHSVVLNDHCSPAIATDSVYVAVTPQAKAAFVNSPSGTISINRILDFINQSKNASSYVWFLGNGDTTSQADPIVSYQDTGTYHVILVARGENGCRNDTSRKTLEVLNGTVLIYAPNVFTPDGDGLNDVFTIKGTGIASYQYDIYNRWGEKIFHTSQTRQNWDGTFKGRLVEQNVYVYTLDVLDIYGDHHYLSGNVAVIW